MEIYLAERIICAIYYFILGIFGLMANIGIFVVLWRCKDYRTRPSSYYLYSILISSILASLYEIPYYIFNVIATLPKPQGNAYETECKIILFLTYSISTVKIFVLAGMSLDRFIAVLYPYFYNAHMAKSLVLKLNILLWLAAIILILPLPVTRGSAVYMGKVGTSCGVYWVAISPSYFASAMILAFLVPAVIMVITNIKVFAVARRQRKQIRVGEERNKDGIKEIQSVDGEIGKPRVYAQEAPQALTQDFAGNDASQKSDGSETNGLIIAIHEASSIKDSDNFKGYTANDLEALGSPKLTTPISLETPNEVRNNAYLTVALQRKSEAMDMPNCRVNVGDDLFALEDAASVIQNLKKIGIASETLENEKNAPEVKNKERKKRPSTASLRKLFRLKRNIEWSIVGSTLLLVAAFFVTWSPFIMSRVINAFTNMLSDRVVLYTTSMTLLDILVNPLIILGTRKMFRNRFYNIICCRH